MPAVKSLSDFNRNQSSIIRELGESQEPLYLTRNGSSSIVVMDAAAFDRVMSFRASVHANEMRVYDSLMRGYADYLDGKIMPACQAEDSILREKGWK